MPEFFLKILLSAISQIAHNILDIYSLWVLCQRMLVFGCSDILLMWSPHDQRNKETDSTLLVCLIQPWMEWYSGGGGRFVMGLGWGVTELIDPQLQVAELENRRRALQNTAWLPSTLHTQAHNKQKRTYRGTIRSRNHQTDENLRKWLRVWESSDSKVHYDPHGELEHFEIRHSFCMSQVSMTLVFACDSWCIIKLDSVY